MKADPQALPPYFNIDPDAALAHLGGPTDTADFDRIAQACAAGRDDLRNRGLGESGQRQKQQQSSN